MKNTKSKQLRLASCLAVAVAAVAVSSGNALAGNFTAGNLVVERLGDNSETLATTGNTIFFDEYSPGGSLIQTIAIPDGTANNPGSNPLVDSGTATSDGSITLSPDGLTLCFPAYATNLPNTVNVTTAAATAVPRAIAKLNGSGAYTLITTSTVAYPNDNIRGAVTDGANNFWASGVSSPAGPDEGIYYFGLANPAAEITQANLRCVNIYDGSLWFSTASSTAPSSYGIYEYTGLPTAAATPTKIINLTSTNGAYNFSVNSAGTVLYYADDGDANVAQSGLHKYVNSGGTWSVASYVVATNACFGLTVNWNTPGGPTLYATTPTVGGNSLIAVQDTGVLATPTVLATAGTKEFFRGVAFVPTNSSAGLTPPSISAITPASILTNAGATAKFTVTATGSAPLSYFWYFETASATNIISGATNQALTLSNVLAANDGSYQVVVSNASLQTATSSVVTLSVIDPFIVTEPASNVFGLLNGTVQLSVLATGTSLSYQWYYSDASGNIIAPVTPGMQANGTVVLSATSSSLTLTNTQPADANNDPTNFVVVVTGFGGNTVKSTVATLESVDLTTILTFWNFNGTPFQNNIAAPPPYFGVGTALPVGTCNDPGTSPFAGSVDPEDGIGGPFPDGLGLPNFSWGTDNYPLTGSNKLNGVQFNVSTVGAKDITLTFDSRVSSTASMYDRLQYTTDGSTWNDYPASSEFNTRSAIYFPFSYDFTGFSNVSDNPDFGVRVVTEYQSTATYGVSANANYVGAFNTYGTAGTVTYDIVNFTGTAITNPYSPPTITGIPDTTTADNIPVSLPFTVGSAATPVGMLTVSAGLVPSPSETGTSTLSPALPLSISGTAPNYHLNVGASSINANVVAGPVEVTVTDTNGDSTVTWFNLTITSVNLPPTNSLTTLPITNMVANGSLTIPFSVKDDRTPANGQSFTFSTASGNNTLVPAANIVIVTNSPTNFTVTITPATNQLGTAEIAVTAYDNDPTEPKSTTANIRLMVTPNTNIVLIDYFDYDNSGPLDLVASGFWNHLSGVLEQMQVSSSAPPTGYALVDTANNTENLQAQFLGASGTSTPFTTNSSGVLYASFIVNMNPTGLANGMPDGNGSYFAVFNDGSGVTGDYECRVLAATNGAAPGFYRLGIDNFGSSAADSEAQMFPMDLTPGSNYVVVTSLVLSNGISSLWINPTNQAAAFHVTDTNTVGTLYNIADFELRESGAAAGTVGLGYLKVGTTFDSVYPALHIALAGTNVVLNWSDPTLGILSSTNVAGPFAPVVGAEPPYTNNSPNSTEFYIFGQ